MIRVPMYKPGKENATRIEFRSPDPTCNPYLAFALMLGAGLKGVEGKYPLPEPVEHDIFEMDAKARAEAGITSLPGSLWEALEEFKQSVMANDVLGDHIFGKVIANKEKEWDMFRIHVTDFEINRYLPML
jgi:glutamine synthetase